MKNFIKPIRDSLGLSQGDVGKASGCSQASICNYEKGISEPTLQAARRISVALQRAGCLHATLDVVFPPQAPEEVAVEVLGDALREAG